MSQPESLPPPLLPTPPRLRRVDRQGGVLHPTGLAEDGEVLGLNLTRGCLLGCAFCSVRASPQLPGDGELVLYERTAVRLAEELDARPQAPRAVFVSPAADPVPAVGGVPAGTAARVRTLAGRGAAAGAGERRPGCPR